MKFKAVRASLVAALTATLLITALPGAFGVYASQTQNPSSSATRRGKNGDPVTKSQDNSENTFSHDNSQDFKREASKSSSAQFVTQQSQAAGLYSSQNPAKIQVRFAPESSAASSPPPSSSSDNQIDSDGQQSDSGQKREPPPFDRPPLNSRGKQANDPPARSQPPQSRQPDSSAGVNDPPQTDRGSGAPPVLRRPTDSRTSDDTNTQSSPPVLRRPSDSQSQDDGRSKSSGSTQQTAPGQHTGDDDVIKLESTLVNLPILVSDRSGRYVPQLTARDFLLYEDGVQQTIANFGTEEVPFSLVLLLDVSPSVSGSVEDIHEAAISFVRQLRSQDRVMVVSFDRHIHYLSEFTNDRRELEFAIRRAQTGSGTSVFDAVYETVQNKLRNVEGRKALILFSDGEDTTSSHASYDDAVHLVTESDVLVYGLRYPGTGVQMGGGGRGIPWPRNPGGGIQLPLPLPLPLPIPWPMPRRRRGPFFLTDPITGSSPATPQQQWPRRHGGGGDFMADITAAGGGPVYDAEKISDMSRVANRIAEELRHVYVISYYPTNPVSNGGYRAVRVNVKGRDDIAVRHRRGYNAKPNGSTRASN
jgi:VWFA-related protein